MTSQSKATLQVSLSSCQPASVFFLDGVATFHPANKRYTRPLPPPVPVPGATLPESEAAGGVVKTWFHLARKLCCSRLLPRTIPPPLPHPIDLPQFLAAILRHRAIARKTVESNIMSGKIAKQRICPAARAAGVTHVHAATAATVRACITPPIRMHMLRVFVILMAGRQQQPLLRKAMMLHRQQLLERFEKVLSALAVHKVRHGMGTLRFYGCDGHPCSQQPLG